MNKSNTEIDSTNFSQLTRWQRMAPVVTLLFLSVIISEILSGSTRITTLFVVLPEIGIWGCGALIIRYLARRWNLGWISIFLLGIALSVVEECVIQQTSLSPLVGVSSDHVYARAFGVNWLYLLWALGYESVWVVLVPIQLTELIFPAQRNDLWIGTRGLWLASIYFVVASFMAWYSWTQMFLPLYFPQEVYRVPWLGIGIGIVVIMVLVVIAFVLQPTSQSVKDATLLAPNPWIIGFASFVFGLSWFLLILLAHGAIPSLPVVIPFFGSFTLAIIAFNLLTSWSKRHNWSDARRLALIFGIVVATILGGTIVMSLNVVFTMSNVVPIDRIGQLFFDVTAIVLLLLLVRRPQFHQS